MLNQLLSADFPRSRALSVVLVAILVALALAPFIFPGTRSLNVAAKVAVFVLLVASYDLLLGYTGIVSFAHTMFFGIGGYGVGIAMAKMGTGWGALALGIGAALGATAAGILYSIWLRYTGPDTTLSFNIMIDILLMVVIGGMGTMYGAVLGATLFVVAQNYLQDLMKLASDALQGIPLLPNLLHPDRWLLWLGVLFILCVYYFPTGIVGKLRAKR